jgi:hypothetical protein
MYNWSTDTKALSADPDALAVWELEQKINYGLGGERLSASVLKKYWNKLTLDPHKKKFLDLILHDK